MSFVRHALFAGSALSAGYYAHWVHQKSKTVPEAHKGSFAVRMQEVASALYKAKKIEDTYTAKTHVDSVANLAANSSIEPFTLRRELVTLPSTYYKGYLQKAMQNMRSTSPAVFAYKQDLPVLNPPPVGAAHKAFLFSGPLNGLYDKEARQDIINGNYMRCDSLCSVKTSKGYQKVDGLITGTTDRLKCSQLQNALLRDAAMVAADDKMEIDDPISDTAVFDYTTNGCNEVGDLTTIPDSVKAKIRDNNFTACNFYELITTRLSKRSFKKCSAIVTGKTEETACVGLQSCHLKKILEDLSKR